MCVYVYREHINIERAKCIYFHPAPFHESIHHYVLNKIPSQLSTVLITNRQSELAKPAAKVNVLVKIITSLILQRL